MAVTRLRTAILSVLIFTCIEARSAINPQAMNASTNSNQMVNLNFQIRAKNKMVKSDMMMPFYQTAELERKVGDKNVLIEVSPRRGKNADEVALLMKFYNASGSKAFYKKEIIAKLNQESKISFRGMSVRVRPVVN